jgi:hypothetical protein
MTPEGRAQPFWSSRARVERIIRSSPAYRGFTAVELTWEDFREKWLPSLEADAIKVGLNWTGVRATGYDLAPSDVLLAVEAAASNLDGGRPATPAAE